MSRDIVNRGNFGGNFGDGAAPEPEGVASAATAALAGIPCLLVVGNSDGGASVFAVGDDDALTNVAYVDDDGTLTLRFGAGAPAVEPGSTPVERGADMMT